MNFQNLNNKQVEILKNIVEEGVDVFDAIKDAKDPDSRKGTKISFFEKINIGSEGKEFAEAVYALNGFSFELMMHSELNALSSAIKDEIFSGKDRITAEVIYYTLGVVQNSFMLIKALQQK